MKKLAKRVLWTLTALCMLFASATAVYGAGGEVEAYGSQTVPVKGQFIDSGETETATISITLYWEDIQFKYHEGTGRTWHPESYTYTYTTDPKWELVSTADFVQVANNSDVPVDVGFTFTPNADLEGKVKYAFALKKGEEVVASSEENAFSRTLEEGRLDEKGAKVTDSIHAHLSLSGELTKDYISEAPIGSITVTVAEVTSTQS
ncbi:MAG: hypothetical protein IJF34_02115 [Clostridia bacterium]|nr:hypothetical protein [Clostridia bacterium]